MSTKSHKPLTIVVNSLIVSLSSALHAGTPVWTFTPLRSTTISMSTTDTATIQYLVTNQSRKTHVLEMRGISGISQNTTSGHCPNPFILDYHESCRLTLTVNGSSLQGSVTGGPVVCEQGNALQCYQPSSSDALNITLTTAPGATTLSTSVSHLALSKTGYNEYGLPGTPPSGVARTITVTNTGNSTASNLFISYPDWPLGTEANSNCGSSLAPSATCTIRIRPGSIATSDVSNQPCTTGTAPVAQTISITADNAGMVSSTAVILGYGCIYQGGYVYALDDRTSASNSVGGKVATTSDQTTAYFPGIIWSSDGMGSYSFIAIYGISQLSTTFSPNPNVNQVPGQTACNGSTDGSCNSNNIYVYYQTAATNSPIDNSLYATGLCKQTIASYSDWYLPAICEMGYGLSPCGSASAPTLQNMQSNLVDNLSRLDGVYWSSTEVSANPVSFAWLQVFNSSGGVQGDIRKDDPLGVRCSRALIL